MVGLGGGEVGGHRDKPDDEGGVNTKHNTARLVEVVWQKPGLEGVVAAGYYQEDIEGK